MAAKATALREKAKTIFNKRYKLKPKDDTYSFPEAHTMFSTAPFAIEPLITIKNNLNATKNLLNSKDIENWRRHTRKTNPCGLVVKHLRDAVKPELCTQAWAKFYEILSSCNIIPQKCIDNKNVTSLHLCEAPGAFIASMNHFIKCNFEDMHWEWLASTLNPFYEGNDTKRMISGERFIIDTLGRWNFGESGDGDLMQWANLECLVEAIGGAGKVDIVTADGSISCADAPDKQETVTGQLLYCEVVAAILSLASGGSLVVKMFTMFEPHTIGLLYLLCCFFEEVEIVKPGTSKPGNSEVYCVCTCFIGPEYLSKDLMEKLKTHYTPLDPEQAFIPRECLPAKFIENIINCARTFSEYQTNAINRNIELFENFSKGKWKFLSKLRNYLSEEFVRRYNIRYLAQGSFIIPHVHLDATQLSYWPESSYDTFCNSGTHETGSYVDRIAASKLGWHERVVLAQDELPCTTEDSLVHEIAKKVESIEWLRGPETPKSDVQHWRVDLGKTMEVIQSSRFCPASLICQLNEARRNANVLHTSQGRQLIETLKSLTKQKLCDFDQTSSLFNVSAVLQKCGLLSKESSPSLLLDISGNGRFVSELLARDLCHPRQCAVILCQNCTAQCNDVGTVVVKSCSNYDATEIDKLRSFGREQVNLDKPQSTSVDDLPCDNNHERFMLNVIEGGVECASNEPPQPFESNPKPFRIVLGSVSNQCRLKESFNDNELSSKITLFNQCLTALRLLKDGDCLVLEIFDTLTQTTVGIIYILHLMFKEIALVSPKFSPTSKQFLVCRYAANSNQSTTLLAHMEKVLKVVTSKQSQKDVIGFLPIKDLFSEKFYKYIRKQATSHVRNQLNWIVKCERLLVTTNKC